MNCCAPLLAAAALASTLGISAGQTLVDGSNYPGLFGPNSSQITVTPPPLAEGTLLDVHPGGSKSGDLGDYWTAQANGGAVMLPTFGLEMLDGTQVVPGTFRIRARTSSCGICAPPSPLMAFQHA